MRRCHRLLCVVLVLRIEKPQWVQVLLELGHTTIQGGEVFVCGLLLVVSQVTAWL